MKLFAPAIVLVSLCAAKVGAIAVQAPDSTAPALEAPGFAPAIEGYEIVTPEWEVEVFPGKPTIKLSGTIQEVHRQLLEQNPNWDTDYPANTTSPKLDKRNFDLSGYNCVGRWKLCYVIPIEDGINYLRRIGGLPSLGGGPGKCGRVSCSYNAAIYWCNDDRGGKTLQGGFDDIADGAQIIVDKCKIGVEWAVVSGQAFATSDWNVIVRGGDRC